MWHKQGFLKTFLLKAAFILMELTFILRKEKNNVLWKCQHARRSMIQCMDAMTDAIMKLCTWRVALVMMCRS